MKNWRDYMNFRKIANPDGSTTHIITVDETDVEVTTEVYEAYAQGAYKMQRMEQRLKSNRYQQDSSGRHVRDESGFSITLPEREISLDMLIENDWDISSDEPSTEDIVFACLEIEELRHALILLEPEEYRLIDALFYQGMSERAYANEIGVSQRTVSKRKHLILNKLRKIIAG